jgi:creatinine amidohydrolase/Fe(II)-dependent formamide hydrolase-like protein
MAALWEWLKEVMFVNLQDALPQQLKKAIDEKWPLLVPAGCVEYHGPHLPLGVDTFIVQDLMRRVAQRVGCLVAPPLWYGPTGYAVSGPQQGTVDVSTERFGRHAMTSSQFLEHRLHWIIVGIHHQVWMARPWRQGGGQITLRIPCSLGDAWWGKLLCRKTTTSSSASRSGRRSCPLRLGRNRHGRPRRFL